MNLLCLCATHGSYFLPHMDDCTCAQWTLFHVTILTKSTGVLFFFLGSYNVLYLGKELFIFYQDYIKYKCLSCLKVKVNNYMTSPKLFLEVKFAGLDRFLPGRHPLAENRSLPLSVPWWITALLFSISPSAHLCQKRVSSDVYCSLFAARVTSALLK